MIWRGLFVLGFGLPVEFFIGVKALSSKKAKVGVAIEARPGLEAKASIEGSITAGNGEGVKADITSENCKAGN
jgi:hypothetical protein